MGDTAGIPERDARSLEEVLRCPVPLLGTGVVLDELFGALSRALGGAGVAVVQRGTTPDDALIGFAGLGDRDRAALARAAGALVADAAVGDGLHLGPGEMRPAGPGAAAPAGTLVTPVPGSRGEAALVVVPADGSPEGTGALAVALAAERTGAAMELGRLRADLDRAMAQILEADERLLGRIGLDIHDGPTQHLSVALLELQLLEAELGESSEAGAALPPSLMPGLQRIYETLGGALTEMRELIGHLRPAQFEGRRLTEILNDAIVGFEARSGCRVEAEMHGEFPVDGVSVTQRITFYRILQEALNNAYRHGRARVVRVHVRETEEGIALRVRDDGAGFDAEGALRPRTGAPIARFGLHGMRDRASVLGGTFAVTSSPGEGAEVRVFLPRWRPGEDVAAAVP